MTDTPNPQKGIFDDIKGAHSRDPEVVDEPVAPEPVKAEEPKKAEPDQKVEGDSGTEETDRLRQQLKRLERQMKNMSPYAQFGLAISQDPTRGKRMADRWTQGKGIFDEEAMVEDVGDGTQAPASSPLTPQDIHKILDERKAIDRQMDDLTELATENLEGFHKIKRSPKFVKALNASLATVWNDPTWDEDAPKEVRDWEDEGAAKNYTAITQAYRYILATNPKVMEAAKAAGKNEAKDKAEAAMAASVSSGGTSSTSEEPSEKSEADEMIERMMNAKGKAGTSFRTVAQKS